MIETLMALWNRGVGGRLVVMVVAFFCICISISLLFVTVGSAWGSLFAHGRTGGEGTRVVNSVLITATAPTSVATASTAPAGATPTITPNPCVASPTEGHGHTSQVDVTRSSGGTSVPSIRTSATPERLRKTPTPGVIITPEAGPSPTPPATVPSVTPTVVVTPTATTLPAVTPTVTTTPAVTPPTSTTPASTPTTGIVATDHVAPHVPPTPAVTAPARSPSAPSRTRRSALASRPSGPRRGGPIRSGTGLDWSRAGFWWTGVWRAHLVDECRCHEDHLGGINPAPIDGHAYLIPVACRVGHKHQGAAEHT